MRVDAFGKVIPPVSRVVSSASREYPLFVDDTTEKLRLFMAIEASPAAKKWLIGLQDTIRKEQPASLFRFVAPENLHVTLHFLGDTPAPVVPTITAGMLTVCSQFAQFSITAGGVGFFPGPYSPRVMWCGVHDRTKTLDTLYRALGDQLASCGIRVDTRPYHPHFTLAYVKKSAPRATLRESAAGLLAAAGRPSPETEVTRVILLQSTLAPGGSIYRELASAPFGPHGERRD